MGGQRIQLYVQDIVLREIDKAAKAHKMSRSEFMTYASMKIINNHDTLGHSVNDRLSYVINVMHDILKDIELDKHNE